MLGSFENVLCFDLINKEENPRKKERKNKRVRRREKKVGKLGEKKKEKKICNRWEVWTVESRRETSNLINSKIKIFYFNPNPNLSDFKEFK